MHVIYIHDKSIVDTFLGLIILVTPCGLKTAFVMNENYMHMQAMFFRKFGYLVCIFFKLV